MMITKNLNEVKFDDSDLTDALSSIKDNYAPSIHSLVIYYKNPEDKQVQLVGVPGAFKNLIEENRNINKTFEQKFKDKTFKKFKIKDNQGTIIASSAILYENEFPECDFVINLLSKIYILFYRSSGFVALQIVNAYILGIVDKWELLQKIVNTVIKLGDYKVGYITLREGDKLYARTVSQNLFSVQVVLKMLGDAFENFYADIEKDDTYTIRAIKENKIYLGNKFEDFVSPPAPKFTSQIGAKLVNVNHHIAIPISTNDGVLGTLNIASDNPYSSNEIAQLKNFSDQIGIAISITDLFKFKEGQLGILKAKNNQLQSLYNLSTNISATLDPDVVAQSAVDTLSGGDLIGAAVFSTLNPETKKSKIVAITKNTLTKAAEKIAGDFMHYEIDISDPKYKDNIAVKAINTRKAQYSNDIGDFMKPDINSKIISGLKKIAANSCVVSHPIISRGRVVGDIAYFLKDKQIEDLEDNQKQLLDTYTLQITIAFENANLFEVTEKTQKNLQQALEELQEVRRQERDMIDIMGHELRTPITIVRNALLVMEGIFKSTGTVPAETLEKYLEMSIESTRREIALIETLLSATKVDAKRLQLSKEKVDMLDVINDSINAFGAIAEEKHLEIDYEKPDKEFWGYADRVRVQEVMDNLLSNAVKYTLKGDIGINISEDGNFIKISVRDSGIGISDEDLPHIGKKFFRAKQYINDDGDEMVVRPGGTGLGLYVVFELVKSMGGVVDIDSKLGEGSTFSFTVPKYEGQKEIKFQETSGNNKKVGVLKFDRDKNNPKPKLEEKEVE